MNQTQRKFVITKGLHLIQQKAEFIMQECREVSHKRKNFIECPEAILEGIQNGTIKPKAKPTAPATQLADVYNMTSFLNKRKKLADKKFGSFDNKNKPIYIDASVINLQIGLLLSYQYVNGYTIHELTKLKKLGDNFIQEVMIGDNEQAAKLLTEIENLL